MQVEVSDWARERIAEMLASGQARDEREAVDRAFAAWNETGMLDEHDQAWWDRLVELDAAADDDVRLDRVRPADDQFFAGLRERIAAVEGPE